MTSARPDAQMSAVGRHIDRQSAGPVFTWWMLKAAIALMDIRGDINAEVGHDFSAHSPYPGLVLVLDEFNSLVGDETLGDDIAHMTDVLAREGRKFGIGIVFAGQSLNLSKLGGEASPCESCPPSTTPTAQAGSRCACSTKPSVLPTPAACTAPLWPRRLVSWCPGRRRARAFLTAVPVLEEVRHLVLLRPPRDDGLAPHHALGYRTSRTRRRTPRTLSPLISPLTASMPGKPRPCSADSGAPQR
ncbi:hypothetical protein STENM223S_00486 [Streptomyces tendae]